MHPLGFLVLGILSAASVWAFSFGWYFGAGDVLFATISFSVCLVLLGLSGALVFGRRRG